MLSFDIGSLQSHAAAVDGELAPNDPIWQEGDVRPSGPIRVVGRLSVAGAGRYYFSGRIEGEAASECRRCLTDVSEGVAVDSHLIFAGDRAIAVMSAIAAELRGALATLRALAASSHLETGNLAAFHAEARRVEVKIGE